MYLCVCIVHRHECSLANSNFFCSRANGLDTENFADFDHLNYGVDDRNES